MNALSGERLLAACDKASGEHALLRAVTLLDAALPECDRTQLVQLPIAERDRLLLQLRQLSFGPVLEGYASCTHCGASMEFSLAVNAALNGLDATQVSASVAWTENGEALHLRQTTTEDLLFALHTPSDGRTEDRLLARCLGFEEMSDQATERVALASVRAQFEQLHRPTELRCTLCCPQCTREESWNLDVPHFVWLEARHAANHLLTEIHTLALHYGWSESAITGMSQQRRNAYLELLNA